MVELICFSKKEEYLQAQKRYNTEFIPEDKDLINKVIKKAINFDNSLTFDIFIMKLLKVRSCLLKNRAFLDRYIKIYKDLNNTSELCNSILSYIDSFLVKNISYDDLVIIVNSLYEEDKYISLSELLAYMRENFDNFFNRKDLNEIYNLVCR